MKLHRNETLLSVHLRRSLMYVNNILFFVIHSIEIIIYKI